MTTTITTIRDRIMALCETIVLPDPLGASHAYTDERECSFQDQYLPAFVVEDAGAQAYARVSSNLYMMARDMRITLYVSPVGDEAYNRDIDEWDLVNECILTVSDFFMGRPRLSLADAGIVESAAMTRDVGGKTLMTKGSTTKYHGTVFRLTVKFSRRVSQSDGYE